MPVHRFYQLDVFTERPLTGNPLAVFPEADGLSAEIMQALAREMNLSETTFVLPSRSATRRVRFFTPQREIPLAGHPTIGTWWLLAELGALGPIEADGRATVSQETGRGVLPVELHFTGARVCKVVMNQATPTFEGRVDDVSSLARALGTAADTLCPAPLPEVVSTALPQLIVPFASQDALERLAPGGGGELVRLLRGHGTECAMCFAPPADDGTVRCRMFAPGLGVPEDPATGSAAGALGAYLVRHGLVTPADGTARLVVVQGVEIGRPSRIEVEVTGETGGAITRVRVGGAAVRVITGEVAL